MAKSFSSVIRQNTKATLAVLESSFFANVGGRKTGCWDFRKNRSFILQRDRSKERERNDSRVLLKFAFCGAAVTFCGSLLRKLSDPVKQRLTAFCFGITNTYRSTALLFSLFLSLSSFAALSLLFFRKYRRTCAERSDLPIHLQLCSPLRARAFSLSHRVIPFLFYSPGRRYPSLCLRGSSVIRAVS